jgi:hypothetical protein
MQNSRNHPIDCGLATTDPFSRQFAKQTIANRSANIVYNQINRVTDPINPTNIQYGDLNVLRYDQGQAVTDFEISIEPNAEGSPYVKSIQSSNESILVNTPENPFLFSYTSNGQCVINTELQNGEKYAQLLKTETLTEYQYDVFQSFVEGSLIEAINDSTLPFLDNSTSPLGHYPYYSTYNAATNTFVKNPSCWLADFDLSGTSVLTAGGSTRMCSMITPSFAVGVRHFQFHPRVGESVVFCTPQNESITRIVESVHYFPYVPQFPIPQNYDFSLIKFTQPVPENIKKYKLFPPNLINYFPINHTFNRFFLVTEPPTQEFYSMRYCPLVGLSHYRWDAEYPAPSGTARNNRFVYLFQTNKANFLDVFQQISFNPHPDYPNYNAGYNPPIQGGDSGGPVFSILNNELILWGGHISGVSIIHNGYLKDMIQEKINEVGPSGETVQTVDVSGFTNFSS